MHKILVISLFSLPFVLFSQYNIDIGGYLGGSNYLGEIGGNEGTKRGFISDVKIDQTRWVLGGFGRYKILSMVSVNASLSYARIQGADSLSSNPQRFGRNLSFRNDFFEFALRGEVNFLHLRDVGNRGVGRMDFMAYGFAGGAVIYHNPKAKYKGEWVALHPLNTEGLSKPYSKIVPTIPLGAGIYFTYNKQHRFGWEFGWRMTFTDYLDDASTVYADPATLKDPIAIDIANRRDELPESDPRTISSKHYGPGGIRGNPNSNDTYMFSQISYSYVLKGQGSFYRSKYQYVIGAKRKKRKTRAKF